MVAVAHRHAIELRAPWYAPRRAVAIHRYLDDDFTERFLADAESGGLDDGASWRAEDTHDGRLKLRQPLHRAFHVVAVEAVCRLPGAPSLAPAHVASAGVVVRRLHDGRPCAWRLVNGRPTGWSRRDVPRPDEDPDSWRELKRAGPFGPKEPPATPTGEETYPLQPLPVRDREGRARTLLWGFLPIGGGSSVPTRPVAGGVALTDAARAELPWPFGTADRRASPPPPQTLDIELQINRNAASPAMVALLRLLMTRFDLGTQAGLARPDNADLLLRLSRLGFHLFHLADSLGLGERRERAADRPLLRADGRVYTLADWLRDSDPNALAAFLAALPLRPAGVTTLPIPPGMPFATSSGLSLLVPAEEAAGLREAIVNRTAAATQAFAAVLPVPRYGHGPQDLYVARAFVRVLRDDGCEHCFWSEPSDPFRVAAPFDPDAQRPTLIVMPGLADLRKAAGKGPAFFMPQDLMNKIGPLFAKDESQKVVDGGTPAEGGFTIGYICSFSLPIIMICALILLMIIFNLLNIVFQWMLWFRICLPVPMPPASRPPES